MARARADGIALPGAADPRRARPAQRKRRRFRMRSRNRRSARRAAGVDSPRAFRMMRVPRGNSSVGRARPCQGRGREFESRFPLQFAQSRPRASGPCRLSCNSRSHATDPVSMARWQSGHAAACKAVYAGSIPTLASMLTCSLPDSPGSAARAPQRLHRERAMAAMRKHGARSPGATPRLRSGHASVAIFPHTPRIIPTMPGWRNRYTQGT